MTDLEITKLCADAIGLHVFESPIRGTIMRFWFMTKEPLRVQTIYDPLHDDAQAMALVKKLELWIQPPGQGHLSSAPSDKWFVAHSSRGGDTKNADLNRSICECVAKLQEIR